MEPLFLLLLILLGLAIGAGALVSLLLKIFFPPRRTPAQAPQALDMQLGYKARAAVLTASEQALLEGLESVLVANHYRILTQVPLSRVLIPETGFDGVDKAHAGAQAALRRYWLDAVICRASDSRPLCAVVFDQSASAREPSVARLLSGAGLGWVIVPRETSHSAENLASALRGKVLVRTLASEREEAASIPEPDSQPPATGTMETETRLGSPRLPHASDGNPLCPRCYAPMKWFGSQEGQGESGAIWRCSRYPRCTTEIAETGQADHAPD